MKVFSSEELSALHNKRFFEVKAAATKKIDQLLANVRDELKADIQKHKISFPKEVDAVNGKIFRGENYLGLPYLVLDYPKHFSKNSVLAFRTMFWWGNFFSFTMQLQGAALDEQRKKLAEQTGKLKKKGLYICVNSNPWQYHYKTDNYKPVDKFTEAELQKMILEKEFIKLSTKIPLKDHKKLPEFCRRMFELLR